MKEYSIGNTNTTNNHYKWCKCVRRREPIVRREQHQMARGQRAEVVPDQLDGGGQRCRGHILAAATATTATLSWKARLVKQLHYPRHGGRSMHIRIK